MVRMNTFIQARSAHANGDSFRSRTLAHRAVVEDSMTVNLEDDLMWCIEKLMFFPGALADIDSALAFLEAINVRAQKNGYTRIKGLALRGKGFFYAYELKFDLAKPCLLFGASGLGRWLEDMVLGWIYYSEQQWLLAHKRFSKSLSGIFRQLKDPGFYELEVLVGIVGLVITALLKLKIERGVKGPLEFKCYLYGQRLEVIVAQGDGFESNFHHRYLAAILCAGC